MKQKVHTLSLERDYRLIGIASHLSAHKISWLFNQELGARFQQADSLLIVEKANQETLKFPTYKFEDDGDVVYNLYSNKAERSTLLKSVKKIDYILKCERLVPGEAFSKYLDKIRKLKNILTAFEIDLSLLKTKEKEYFK